MQEHKGATKEQEHRGAARDGKDGSGIWDVVASGVIGYICIVMGYNVYRV